MNDLLTKYANLVVKIGLNVRPGQDVYINSPIEAYPFARKLAEVAYLEKARHVHINYRDDVLASNQYKYESLETLKTFPSWKEAYYKEIVSTDACVITIDSPNPEVFEGVDQEKISETSKVSSKILSFYQEHLMKSVCQWAVVAYPNLLWAKKVFPDATDEEALNNLFKAIYQASYIDEKTDPVKNWENHLLKLTNYVKRLNEYDFDYLHFENSLGTNLKIPLVKNHMWAGGDELSLNGVRFLPNIPTEEVFTMPSRTKVEGTLKSTKPLSYNGSLIENFTLVFKEGKVVDFSAEKGYDALKNLLDFDEGSRHLGEVALISNDSAISKMNILFYNTLFDENASCHVALGNAYPMNIKCGVKMSNQELKENDVNLSDQHVDLMFGSSDMKVKGIKKDKTEVIIFDQGNFVF